MSKNVLDRMKSLVLSKDSCVLATSAADKPHCSLMVYVSDDQCREIYMATHQKGTKYANLKQNPNVSLLIDTREDHQGENRPKALSLTISGTFSEIQDPQRKTAVARRLVARHPQLTDFMNDAQAAVFAVKVGSFLLLDGLTRAHHGIMEESGTN